MSILIAALAVIPLFFTYCLCYIAGHTKTPEEQAYEDMEQLKYLERYKHRKRYHK